MEMLDLVSVAGEYDTLEVRRSEETIMRGRRRGRNKSLHPDTQGSGSEAVPAPLPTGSVTLVDTSVPVEIDPIASDDSTGPVSPEVIDREPAMGLRSTSHSGGTPLKETISQVATAHAQLDNVLPPHAAGTVNTPGPAGGRSGPGKMEHSSPANRHSAPREPITHTEVDAPDLVNPLSDRQSGAVESGQPEPDLTAPLPESDAERVVLEPKNGEDGSRLRNQSASANPLPRVLAVANQKGGVGKTTTSVNLGAALAEIGYRVLVIDLDPQGNATTGLGIDARNFELSMYDVLMRDASLEDCVEPTSMKNLFVAPATIALAGAEIELVPAFSRELKLKRSIESVIDDFDYVLIDCPPSLGLITVNALAAAHEVLVPIQCEYYALEGLSQLMRNVHLVASNLNPKLDISTIVLTMYDARTKLAEQVANEVRLHFGAKVCRSVIPRTVRLSEAPSFGQPITAFDPTSRGAIAYRELAKEVSGGAT